MMLEKVPTETDLLQGKQDKINHFWALWFDKLRKIVNPTIILTANLPAAGTQTPGTIIIEDVGSDVFKIILYSVTHRYRFTGVSF